MLLELFWQTILLESCENFARIKWQEFLLESCQNFARIERIKNLWVKKLAWVCWSMFLANKTNLNIPLLKLITPYNTLSCTHFFTKALLILRIFEGCVRLKRTLSVGFASILHVFWCARSGWTHSRVPFMGAPRVGVDEIVDKIRCCTPRLRFWNNPSSHRKKPSRFDSCGYESKMLFNFDWFKQPQFNLLT